MAEKIPVIEIDERDDDMIIKMENLEFHPDDKFNIRISRDETITLFNELIVATR